MLSTRLYFSIGASAVASIIRGKIRQPLCFFSPLTGQPATRPLAPTAVTQQGRRDPPRALSRSHHTAYPGRLLATIVGQCLSRRSCRPQERRGQQSKGIPDPSNALSSGTPGRGYKGHLISSLPPLLFVLTIQLCARICLSKANRIFRSVHCLSHKPSLS